VSSDAHATVPGQRQDGARRVVVHLAAAAHGAIGQAELHGAEREFHGSVWRGGSSRSASTTRSWSASLMAGNSGSEMQRA
jgi:hypothetical protein